MNKVIISGRATEAPMYYPEKTGKDALAIFDLAMHDIGDKTTLFVRCQAYGKQADIANRQIYKGVKVLVEGKLATYNNKLVIRVGSVEVLEHTKEYLEKYGGKTEFSSNSSSSGIKTDKDGFMSIDVDEKLPWD